MQHIRWPYDIDPTGQGFFCPALEQKRRDYFALKVFRPSEAESVYQCRPGARVGAIFVEEDFRYYEAPIGLELGRGAAPGIARWVEQLGGTVAQGWDTAMSASSQADHSVCVTVMLVPCEEFHRENEAILLGECDQHYDVYILDVYRGKLDIGDLALEIRKQAIKWNPEKIIIEKKASGASAIQAVANSGLLIEGVVPQENKRERAINGGAGAGSVQGWFRAGRVLFPHMPEPLKVHWLEPFIREIKDFSGEKGSVDDQVDAMVHVVSYGIREGSVGVQFPEGWRTPQSVDDNMRKVVSTIGSVFNGEIPVEAQALINAGLAVDPFSDRCGRCKHFNSRKRPSCTSRKSMVTAINPACDNFDDGNTISWAF